MVPRVLVQRDTQRQVLGPSRFEAHFAVVVLGEARRGSEREFRDLREHRVLLGGALRLKHLAQRRVPELSRERRALVHGHLPGDDRGCLPELQREFRGGV